MNLSVMHFNFSFFVLVVVLEITQVLLAPLIFAAGTDTGILPFGKHFTCFYFLRVEDDFSTQLAPPASDVCSASLSSNIFCISSPHLFISGQR